MSAQIIAFSLVKELLASCGLKSTLNSFVDEISNLVHKPLISSRKELASALGILSAVKKSQEKAGSNLSYLEIFVEFYLVKTKSKKIRDNEQAMHNRPANTRIEHISVESLEDLELSDNEAPRSSTNASITPLDISLVKELKSLIFPSTGAKSFQPEWLGKGFQFNENEEVSYGLLQIKGGPCGLIAAYQALLLKHLVYENPKTKNDFDVKKAKFLCPTHIERNNALVAAISESIWNAGGTKSGKLVAKMYDTFDPKNVFKNLGFMEFDSYQKLHGAFLHAENSGNGFIQVLLSVVLSGKFRIKDDMDSFSDGLIGKYSYCTQEMVNLILNGRAFSHIHNENQEFGGAELKGLACRSQIGQLSLFEYFGNLKVGSYAKDPYYPIFVVCSESHYTVLFALQVNSKIPGNKDKFSLPIELLYYDSLANQTSEIRLTVKNGISKRDPDTAPPLELCIETKWGANVLVDWNGTEPLL